LSLDIFLHFFGTGLSYSKKLFYRKGKKISAFPCLMVLSFCLSYMHVKITKAQGAYKSNIKKQKS